MFEYKTHQFELMGRRVCCDDRVGDFERHSSELAQLIAPHFAQTLAVATHDHSRRLRIHEEGKPRVVHFLPENCCRILNSVLAKAVICLRDLINKTVLERFLSNCFHELEDELCGVFVRLSEMHVAIGVEL